MFHWREIKIAVNVIIFKSVLGTGRCDPNTKLQQGAASPDKGLW